MGGKADNGEGGSQSVRSLTRSGDDGLMSAMNAVEGTDSDGGTAQILRQVAPVCDDLDQDQPLPGRRRRGTRTTAMPSMISLSSTKPSQFSSTRAVSGSTDRTVMRIRTVSPIRTG